MRRRDILVGAGLAAGARVSLPTPAIAQGIRQLTLVTDWPEGPGLLPSARRLAQSIKVASDGRLRIKVFASGELVKPFETFDAVQAGVADMFHSHIGYYERKSPALLFFYGVPFGFAVNELYAWIRFGGGQELWDETCKKFNIKPLFCCTTGTQMGGWFLDEITSTEELRGLRYRMAGPGAEVYRRLGATVVLLAPADIVPSLKSGAIDACEWIGPWLDMAMGLHRIAGYYYYPGWHEPGGALTLGINTRVWASLNESDRQLIEGSAASEYAVSLAEFNANNALALAKLRAASNIKIRKFDESLLKTFALISKDVIAEAGASDKPTAQIYRSYMGFRDLIQDWSNIADGAYLGARALV